MLSTDNNIKVNRSLSHWCFFFWNFTKYVHCYDRVGVNVIFFVFSFQHQQEKRFWFRSSKEISFKKCWLSFFRWAVHTGMLVLLKCLTHVIQNLSMYYHTKLQKPVMSWILCNYRHLLTQLHPTSGLKQILGLYMPKNEW